MFQPLFLSQGSIVRGRQLQGERLNYDLLVGTGPSNGWISLKLKALCFWKEQLR